MHPRQRFPCCRFSAPLFPDYLLSSRSPHVSGLPQIELSEAARLVAAEYRLCPKGKNVTEECFQQMPLEPATDKQYIMYGAIKIEPPVSAKLFLYATSCRALKGLFR